jgi:hypothetical protein
MAVKTASKVGVFFYHCLFVCRPGSRRGNIEQLVTRWRHSEDSGIALDMLHWQFQMHILNASAWSSKWPAKERHSFVIVASFV